MVNVSIYLIALLPLLSLFMVSIAIIAFSIGALLNSFYYQKIKQIKIESLKVVLLCVLPFLMYLISLLWTEDFNSGLKIIEKNLAFLILPSVVFVLKPFKTCAQLKIFKKIFVCSAAFSVIITSCYLLFNLRGILTAQNAYSINIKLRESIELVPIIGEHSIYFSLILALAIVLLFFNSFNYRWLNIALYVLFILGISIASSKGVILAVLLVVVVGVFQRFRNIKKAITVLFFSFLCFGFIVYFSPIKERLNEIIESKYIYPEGVHYNSFNLRMAIYNCSLSLIKDTPIIGFAPADTQKQLNECYKKFNTNAFFEKNYNTHNQYFDYFLSFGILGLMIILFSFTYFLRIAIVNNNYEYLCFLTLFYTAFLTENILVRNTGIVLFVTFNCLFAYSTLFTKELNQNLNLKS